MKLSLVTPANISAGTAWVPQVKDLLGRAQSAAALATNNNGNVTAWEVFQGVRHAERAVELLRIATPVSKFQDLAQARLLIEDGAHFLRRSADAVDVPTPGAGDKAVVVDFARRAFDSFEDAFEIVDND
ncbi:MAG: hypothetical protein JWO69_1811 [Thermoleophilia bacterium]|nr:hypothetical protein [Thermoleophilia bacterium]